MLHIVPDSGWQNPRRVYINDSVVIRKYEYWGKMLCAVIIYITTFVIPDSRWEKQTSNM